MENQSNIHEIMFQETKEGHIFKKATSYGLKHLDTVFERKVYPTQEAIDNLHVFDENFPSGSTESSKIIDMLHKRSDANIASIGGRFFGFVCGSSTPVGIASKNLATYWDQSPSIHVLTPLCSKLETVTENWLKEIFNLPESTVAGFVNGTSTGTLCAIAAARFRILERQGWDVNKKGLFNAPLIKVVTGDEAHSTVFKALAILGLGDDSIEFAETDDHGRLIPELLPELDDKTIVVIQAGNVNGGAFDNFVEICKKANEANAWVHIDGAFGLWASAVPELKHLTEGIELADSWSTDGHKTLNTPYDSGIVLCKDGEALTSALHIQGSYIVLSKERDGMFYTPDMSRRARIVELWATLKFLGKTGLEQLVYTLHLRTLQFAEELKMVEGFEIMNDVVFNQLVISCETDEITTKTIEKIQQLRECWVGGATWRGKKVIRVSISSWATTPEDVTRSVNSFKKAISS